MTIWDRVFGVAEARPPRSRTNTASRIAKETVEEQFRRKLAEAQQGGVDLDGALAQLRAAREARLQEAL
jgi:hypothetical protein